MLQSNHGSFHSEAMVYLLREITIFLSISVLTVFISNNGHCMSNESINSLEKISHIYALTTLFILLLKNEFIYTFKNIYLILKAQTLLLHFKAYGNCC